MLGHRRAKSKSINHPTAQSAQLKAQVSDFWGRSGLTVQVFMKLPLT